MPPVLGKIFLTPRLRACSVAESCLCSDSVSSEHPSEQFWDFFHTAAVPIHLVGADGVILSANRAELAMLGYRASDYVGHHISEFHVDAGVGAELAERVQSGEPLRNYEARLRCADGTVKHVLISSAVRRDGDRILHARC